MIAVISYLSNTGAGGYFDIFDWRASTEKLASGGYLNYLQTTIYANKSGATLTVYRSSSSVGAL